jgi:hypothetical protein
MRSAALALLLALAALPAAAQDEVDPHEAVYAGVLADGPTVTESQARSACLELPAAWVANHPRADDLEATCDPEESGELERTGDRRWFWTRYRRTTVVPDEDRASGAPADTVVEEEVVLFSAPLDRDALTAEWHARYWTQYVARMHVETGPTDGDDALLAVLACVNGTGGCGQLFLLRDTRGWRPVRQAWVDQLPAELGGELWKGWRISPLTLQGAAGFYRRDDANCCPSRTLYFRVRLDGDALVLRDHRVVDSVFD